MTARPALRGSLDLTAMPTKLDHFRRERGKYLATSLAAAEHAFGAALDRRLSELAVIVVQPDALAQRLVARCLEYLAGRDFVPVLAVPVTLTPAMARTLWRYQFNAKTEGSRAIGEAVYCRGPSLLLMLRDTTASTVLPASQRLTMIKGSSSPARRGPQDLRSVLGAVNRIFRCVHSPDEPADVLREMAVLLEGQLCHVYDRVAEGFANGSQYDCRREVEQLYSLTPPHDIHVGRAATRLRHEVRYALGGGRNAAVARIDQVIDRLERGEPDLDWYQFAQDLSAVHVNPTGWDALLVASSLVPYEVPGQSKIIGSLSSPEQMPAPSAEQNPGS